MKKKIMAALAVVMCVIACAMTLTACTSIEMRKIAGTYEMVSISGTITYNGQTTQLDEDLYEYYRITLEKDGDAKVEIKGTVNTLAVEADAEWEYEDGKIKLITKQGGMKVVEIMDYEDGAITYTANQTVQGMAISMTIILERA